jgi:hypothetical protein
MSSNCTLDGFPHVSQTALERNVFIALPMPLGFLGLLNFCSRGLEPGKLKEDASGGYVIFEMILRPCWAVRIVEG